MRRRRDAATLIADIARYALDYASALLPMLIVMRRRLPACR